MLQSIDSFCDEEFQQNSDKTDRGNESSAAMLVERVVFLGAPGGRGGAMRDPNGLVGTLGWGFSDGSISHNHTAMAIVRVPVNLFLSLTGTFSGIFYPLILFSLFMHWQRSQSEQPARCFPLSYPN